ncbi:hypothetical protein SESBI_42912 [Sesbania bispinosa]|nr:hypothetical protein SESBI_42912 [Sesbania bispinosa]
MSNSGNAPQVRVLGSSSSGPIYDWVHPEVLEKATEYLTSESVQNFREDYDIGNPRIEKSIIVEPCLPDDFVCHNKKSINDPDLIFWYDTLTSKLGVTLPISQFESSVLRSLNVAPTQLHPNSWTFVRAFIIICEYFGFKPTARKFFYFFQNKSPELVGWTSLNSVPRKGFLMPFLQSYKHFKTKFFKVRGDESFPELLFGTDGPPQFPLYWTTNPSRIAGLTESDLSDRAKVEVKFLKPKAISCADVIEAKDDPTALTRLLGLGQKRDTSTSNNQNSQAEGTQGPGTPTSTMAPIPPSPKRLRTEASSDNTSNPSVQTQTVPEANCPPSVERPTEKWWLYFREFESAEDAEVISTFYRRFPMVNVIEGNLCKAADRARIQRAGLRNTASIAQSMAARTSFLVHGLGHGIDVLQKENFELKQKLRVLSNSEAVIKELTQKVSSLEVVAGRIPVLEKDVETQMSKVRELEATNQKLSEKTEMSSTISSLQEEKTKLSTNFEQASVVWQTGEKELRTDMALYHGNGFEKAISQVQLLYPNLDLSQVGMFKEIVDGSLVDPPEDD